MKKTRKPEPKLRVLSATDLRVVTGGTESSLSAPVAPAMNNPLYIGAGRSGHNPLHKA